MRAAGRRVQSVQGVAGSIHFRGFEQPRLWATLFVSLRDSFTPSLPHIQVSTCTHTLRVTHRRITATCWRLMVDDLRCGSLAAAPLPLCGTMPCVFKRARCSVTICSSLMHAGALRDFIFQEVVTAILALRLYHCQLGSAVVASKLPGFVFDMMDKTRAKKKNDSVCSESESE